MKIVSCFSKLAEIEPLITAGADELYCATRSLPAFGPGFLEGRKNLEIAAKKIHSFGKRFALAVNGAHPVYTERGLRLRLLPLLTAAADAGVDAFIVSNPSILTLLTETGSRLRSKIHLSSVQPCFNSAAARFFIRSGVSRIILPSQISSREARALLSYCVKARVETEIFDYRFFGCVYVNGRCNLHNPVFHTFHKGADIASLCRLGRNAGAQAKIESFDVHPGRSSKLPELCLRLSSRMTCGGPPRISNAGSFFDFFAMGVNFLKYGTRLDPCGVKLRKVKELRAMIRLAEELTSGPGRKNARAAFIERMSSWEPLGASKR